MRKFSKKIIASVLSLTLIVGSAVSVSAAVKNGTDVSASKSWSSYSVYTKEDHKSTESTAKANVCWYHSLTNTPRGVITNQHYVNDPVTQSQLDALNKAIKENNKLFGTKDPTVTKHADTWGEQDSHKCFGENAKISKKTADSFTMDVVSTGWSAIWNPSTGEAAQSNPWGVTATKIVNVDRGRYYNVSFKIKSTLSNEITKEAPARKDNTYYNVGTGKYNYVKHIHFKTYDNLDEKGKALDLVSLKATQGGKSVLETKKAYTAAFNPLVKLDSKNTADDGWVSVSFKVMIPGAKSLYQAKKSQATMGFKFAFGALLKEYKDENDMSGTIEVKDFKMIAGLQTPVQPGSIKAKKVTQKSIKLAYGASKAAKNYEVQYSTKKNLKSGVKTKKLKKTSCTINKLKKGTTYYIRVRGTMKNGSKTYNSPWSKKLKVTTKK